MTAHLFNERGVTITHNALNAGGQMFALNDIRNTHIVKGQKNKILPLSLICPGLALTVIGGITLSGAGLTLGLMLMVIGALAWLFQDVQHRLMVDTSNGEREVLSSAGLDFVQRVDHALRHELEQISSQPSASVRD